MKKVRTVKTLSYSQMGTYLACPRAWYEKYVLKHWPEVKSQALSFGTAYHSAMEVMCEDWVRDKELALQNALTRFEFEYSFGKNAGPKPKTYIKQADYLLTAMKEFLEMNDFVPSGIERKCQKPGFKGVADCICLFNGKKTIIDWKTSSYPYDQERIDTDEQLTAYGWMLDGEWEQLAFCVVNKRNKDIYWYPTYRTQEQIKEFQKKVDRVRLELETKEKFLGVHCKEQCMAWNRKCDLWETGYCNGLDDF